MLEKQIGKIIINLKRGINMKFKLALVFSLCVMVGILTGCSSDPVMPEEPATGTGTTDGTGISTVSAGPYSIEVSVVNTSLSPVTGASVACYLLHEHLLAIASLPNGSYYPGLVVVDLEDAQRRHSVGGGAGPELVGTAKAARETEISVEVIVHSASIAAYGYDSDPEYYDLIQSDSWTTEMTETMDMERGPSAGLLPARTDQLLRGVRQPYEPQTQAFRRRYRYRNHHDISRRAPAAHEHRRRGHVQGFLDAVYPDLGRKSLGSRFAPVHPRNPWRLRYPGVSRLFRLGPEHITIWDEFPGTYIYAVYHYSGSGTITTSEADVGVLMPDGTVESFSVPDEVTAGDNYWWHVCNIDGTTGVITVVDTIAASSPGTGYYMVPGGGLDIMPPKNTQ